MGIYEHLIRNYNFRGENTFISKNLLHVGKEEPVKMPKKNFSNWLKEKVRKSKLARHEKKSLLKKLGALQLKN